MAGMSEKVFEWTEHIPTDSMKGEC